jgi:hypothetical protein
MLSDRVCGLVFGVDLHGEVRHICIGLLEAVLGYCFVEGQVSYSRGNTVCADDSSVFSRLVGI